jgi:hypothetical protein
MSKRLTHELKTWPRYFMAIRNGSKPFEIRFNDRGYQLGDTLLLYEHDELGYSGRRLQAVVSYMLSAQDFAGLSEGYVALGLQSIEQLKDGVPDEMGQCRMMRGSSF